MKSLNDKISIEGLNSITQAHTMYIEFFIRGDYNWWYEVGPGDIVVDIGACVGFFTCLALDKGAKKVYSVEPNPNLVNTILKNTAVHTVNKQENPLVIVNKAIGTENCFLKNIHGDTDNFKPCSIKFKDFIEFYNIEYIDYLKIDCEGGEYDILTTENLNFLKNKVKHIAIEVHLDCFEDAPKKFTHFRDTFLSQFKKEQINFFEQDGYEKTFNTNWLQRKWPIGWGSSWMIYISNFK